MAGVDSKQIRGGGKRNIGIDLLRILLSISVVCTHFGDGAFILSSVHVPAFMIMSFFYNEKMISNVDKEKITLRMKRLFVPYIGWALIYWVLEKYFLRNPDIQLSDLFFQLLDGRGINLNGAMWFHFNLIIITMLFIVLYIVFLNNAFYIILFMAVLALVLQCTNINYLICAQLRTELMYSLGRLCEMLPYAVMGMSLSTLKIFNLIEKKKIEKPILIISLISYICLVRSGLVYLAPNGFDYQGVYRIIAAVMIVTSFYFVPMTRIQASVCNVVSFISRYSMGVYCSHLIIGRNLIKYLDGRNIQRSALTDVAIVYMLSFFISFLIAKLPIKGSEKLVT